MVVLTHMELAAVFLIATGFAFGLFVLTLIAAGAMKRRRQARRSQ